MQVNISIECILTTFFFLFIYHVGRLIELKSLRVIEHIQWLAQGPNNVVRRFNGYIIGGVRFHTKERESKRKTQNSGVIVTSKTSDFEDNIIYYGVTKEMIELNYFEHFRIVLFKCDWFDTKKRRGVKKDAFGFTLVNFSKLIHTCTNLLDEPFVFASQVQ